jgi:LemA protein
MSSLARLPSGAEHRGVVSRRIEMTLTLPRLGGLLAAALSLMTLASCGYNTIPTLEEHAKAKWADVQNNYQRRADLIPNLVATVEGFAKQEKDVLTSVVEARAKATQMRVDASQLTDPEKMKQFQDAQNQLSGALGRLIAISENYPDLKSNQNFLALQSQLEGTENRIAVARNRHIKTVQDYNVLVREFPVNLTAMAFGYKTKPNFTVENEREISSAPKVDFSKPAEKK